MCSAHRSVLLLAIGITYFSKYGNGQFSINLPSKVILPENTATGTTVFTVESAILQEGGFIRVVSMFPSDTEKVFQFDTKNNRVVVKNGSLLNFEGLNKAYVIRLEEQIQVRRKRQVPIDLTLLIELQDVREVSDLMPWSSSGTCCDDVRKIIWLTPVCSVLELLAVVICSVIVAICFIKKGNRTTVEPFNPGK
ncbi:uncharacterized protein LOC125647925 [Ostrea edulis]|uniref:uncharacterized protein LOC125647925 n=1 Tax=Ostrea edulis TaxID=37623 RepID=UPI0024AFC270|nr:uncharacterized protein LOC125647925 [Ostrea edulis]